MSSRQATADGTTPRPWTASTFAIYGSNGVPAAHTGGCCRSNKERLANAKLIADSVNERDALLAEVGRLREALELLQGFDFRLDDSPHGKEIRRRAVAALSGMGAAKVSAAGIEVKGITHEQD